MKKLIPIIFLFLVTGLSPVVGQSNGDLTQWNRYLLNQNPAYAGYYNVLTAGVAHRSQWVGLSGAPTTQLFELQAPLKKPGVALGLTYNHYTIGRFTQNDVMLNYAYRIQTRDYSLSLGLALGFTVGTREFADLEDNALDPAFSDEGKSYFLPNAGFGVVYTTKTFHAGIAIPRLLGQKTAADGSISSGFDVGSMMIRATGSADVDITRDIILTPNLLVKYGIGWLFQATVGVDATLRETFSAGLGYRTSEAIYLKLGYYINRQFSAMYSFDFLNLGKVGENLGGSHEIGIVYHFGYTVVSSSPRDF